MINVPIINKSKHSLPNYQTVGSAGMDIHANIETKLVVKPMERTLVPTGLFFAIPLGYEVQIRPRSGLAFKHGISIPNSPATIDSDYRGELRVILINLGTEDFEINDGDRIAQMVLARHETIQWEEVDELEDPKTRSQEGFGSTGK